MHKGANLNHWKRLGVVLIVAYILAAAIYSVAHYENSRGYHDRNEFTKYEAFTEQEKLERKQSLYLRCKSEGVYLTDNNDEPTGLEDCESFSKLDIGQFYHKSPNYTAFIFYLILVPVVLWVAVWLLVVIFKWVLTGRKHA